jgi:hypothetical protein
MNRVYALIIFAGVFATITGLFTTPWVLFAGLAFAFGGLYADAVARQRVQTGRLTLWQRTQSARLWREFDRSQPIPGEVTA